MKKLVERVIGSIPMTQEEIQGIQESLESTQDWYDKMCQSIGIVGKYQFVYNGQIHEVTIDEWLPQDDGTFKVRFCLDGIVHIVSEEQVEAVS